MELEFAKSILEKEGRVEVNNVVYRINATLLNSVLIRLHCAVLQKKTTMQYDGIGGEEPVEELVEVGNITLENGRQVADLQQTEDSIAHLTVFNQILDEVTEKETEVKTPKK